MSFRALPPQDQLREMFDYNSHTGILLNRRLNKRAGFVVKGGNSTKRHWAVKIGRHYYTQQRVIWMWVHGEDPGAFLVDHEDQDGLNNRLSNLRLVTRAENRRNSKLNKNNTSKIRGVYRNNKGWIARPTIDGKLKSLGTFATKEEAAAAIERHFRTT